MPGSPTASARSVTWALQNIAPPSNLYIDRDDVLYLQGMTALAGEVITVNYRVLQPSGNIVTEQQVIQLPTAYNFAIPQPFYTISEGYLLSIAAVASLASKRGQTFLRAAIIRAGKVLGNAALALFSDYISSSQVAGWPYGRQLDPLEGPGALRIINVGNPAAGADWVLQGNPNTRWVLRHISALLTTAAAVANRNPRLQFKPLGGSAVSRQIPSPADQAASLAITYSLAASPIAATTASAVNTWADDSPIIIEGGGQILTSTANIQAADQWSAIEVGVEEWLLGA